MYILGTMADCNGWAMNTTDGELALRLRSPAFRGGSHAVQWLISDGAGMWYEPQPGESERLEDQYQKAFKEKSHAGTYANTYEAF